MLYFNLLSKRFDADLLLPHLRAVATQTCLHRAKSCVRLDLLRLEFGNYVVTSKGRSLRI
ncbi:hypothetical protein WS55_29140 [Burkholderia pseudomultivorans]|nr:hypothetical protein WS55_29140 [Burkholderia pseudomultivorans]KVC41987.1 hypothetical protein WS56_01440 [Burkholderia pseudomultivorans]KVG62186.1 hypothetical protein WS80_26405 [Burkholderia pseudomultivorans]KWI49645.1 hypothetical protein WT72_26610 [Burkholderia pseudomultivorans]